MARSVLYGHRRVKWGVKGVSLTCPMSGISHLWITQASVSARPVSRLPLSQGQENDRYGIRAEGEGQGDGPGIWPEGKKGPPSSAAWAGARLR